MAINAASNSRKPHILLATGLFFLSPLVAEFLLGNLPIQMLPALIVLAPLYGGGALLIREFVRHTGRGWPTIAVLALAYGVLEEAFTTQSLFNPNYLSLNLHLLNAAYIPALGIGAWWTLFVLTLHTVWSICAPIALIEALAPAAAATPWLGRVRLTVTALLFVFGICASTLIGYKHDHFLASPAQLLSAAVICVLLVLIATRIPQRSTTTTTRVPSAWIAGTLTFLAGSAVLLVPQRWGWGAVIALLALILLVSTAVLLWSRSSTWNMAHNLALASGAALAYAWHAFFQIPVFGSNLFLVRLGNALFALGALTLIAAAAAKNRSNVSQHATPAQTVLTSQP